MITSKQVAVLPVRRVKSGAFEILLVTSRSTGRWIIPKGWPSKRLKDHRAAAREAKDEAGVEGKIKRKASRRRHWRSQLRARRARAWRRVRQPDRDAPKASLLGMFCPNVLGTPSDFRRQNDSRIIPNVAAPAIENATSTSNPVSL
jgi:8-oxo-dGTP pyrophosphatase MutT (NUDIX family)